VRLTVSRSRLAVLLVLLATLGRAGAAHAQADAMTRTRCAFDTVADGIVRGTVTFKRNSRQSVAGLATPVSGTAQWRLELDSLDWRRKLTLRLTLDGPPRASYVIRTADARPPQEVLESTPSPSRSHLDTHRFVATRSVDARSGRRVSEQLSAYGDSLFIQRVDSLSPDVVLRGSIRLLRFPDPTTGAKHRPREQTSQLLDAVFAATFNRRADPVPRTMNASLQERIIGNALDLFAIRWAEGAVDASAADSSRDTGRARAYLLGHWGEAAILDSVSASGNAFYVRMHGRYARISCVVTSRMYAPKCSRH
jgi:hypothetical protein